MFRKLKNIPRDLILFFIKGYRLILSPLLGSRCRYYPSCSEYTNESLNRHGAIKGLILGISRISRCVPYAKGGIDLPPKEFSWKGVGKMWYNFTLKRD